MKNFQVLIFSIVFLAKKLQAISVIKLYRNDYQIEHINIKSLNLSENTIYHYNGKIMFLESYLEIEKVIKLYKYYYKKWIFCINDTNEISKMLEYFENSEFTELSKSPIIIPEEIAGNITMKNHTNQIFSVTSKMFLYLRNFEFYEANYNSFALLVVNNLFFDTPYTYLKIVLFVALILLGALIYFWRRLYLKNLRRNKFILSKAVIIFSLLKFLSISTLFYKIKTSEENSSRSNGKGYSQLILLAVNLVFKTLIWFFGIFVSDGWGITFNVLERNELKEYFRKYTFIYFALCLDEALDNLYSTESTICYPSEIKNLVLFFFLLLVIFFKGKSTYKFLKTRLFEARFGFYDYVPIFRTKIKMIRWHLIINTAYFVAYSFVITLMNIQYTSNEFKEVHYNAIDLILILGYTIIYRPRNFPVLFNEVVTSEFHYYNNVYKMNVPMLNLADFGKANIESPGPIVVVNPGAETKDEMEKMNSLINNCLVGILSKKKEKEEK